MYDGRPVIKAINRPTQGDLLLSSNKINTGVDRADASLFNGSVRQCTSTSRLP